MQNATNLAEAVVKLPMKNYQITSKMTFWKFFDRVKVSLPARMVLKTLLDYFNNSDSFCNVRQSVLAEATGMDRTAVNRAVSELRSLGLIVSVAKNGRDFDGRSLKYYLTKKFFHILYKYTAAVTQSNSSCVTAQQHEHSHERDILTSSCKANNILEGKNNTPLMIKNNNNDDDSLENSENSKIPENATSHTTDQTNDVPKPSFNPEETREFNALVAKLEALNFAGHISFIKRYGITAVSKALQSIEQDKSIRNPGGFLRTALDRNMDLSGNIIKNNAFKDKIMDYMNKDSFLTNKQTAKYSIMGFIDDLRYNKVSDSDKREERVKYILAILYIWEFTKCDIDSLYYFEDIINANDISIKKTHNLKTEISAILENYQDKISALKAKWQHLAFSEL